MRKILLSLSALIIITYLSVVGLLYINQRSLQYYPDKNIEEISKYNLPNTQDIMVKGSDGLNIQLWFHKPKKDMPMVLYLHGNAYTLGYRSPRFKKLIDMGFGFVAPAYHGFSKSEGKPNKANILADVVTSIKFMQEKGFKTEDTIIIGESLGSGVAATIAAQYQFKGVFLITPYTSIANRAQEIYWYLPIKFLVKDNFSTEENIALIHAPLLMVHGTNDTVIPYTHSEKLMSIAKEPKKLIIYPEMTHSNLNDDLILKEMKEYFVDNKTSEK